MKEMSSRIRQARRRATFSQSALASRLQLNRSAVAQWEKQGGSRPTSENLSKIAVVTAVQYEWLATGRGRMTPQADGDDGQLLLLHYYAQDEIEERMLAGLRQLGFGQPLAITEMVEALVRNQLR